MSHAQSTCLEGLRVAVVEDELLTALAVDEAPLDARVRVVGIAGTVAHAFGLVEREEPLGVMLDGSLKWATQRVRRHSASATS